VAGEALLVSRLLLAGVFLVAGIAKLADRRGTRQAVADFGAPERVAGPLALVLPIAELTVAALLLPAATAIVGAIAALALLLLFSAAIAVNLARGRAPDCHCFGQLHSAPASWKTLARNGVLAGIALFALVVSLAEPEPSAVAWIGRLDPVEILALAVIAVALVLLAVGGAAFLSLLRSYGRVLVRLERVEAALAEAGIDLDEDAEMPEIGLEPGTPAPEFWATSLTGETVSRATLSSSGTPSLLLFTSPRCASCKTLQPAAAEWQREYAAQLTILFASDGSSHDVRAEAEKYELEHVLLDEKQYLYDAFQANGTPSAVLIRSDGTIGSWLASGQTAIETLVAYALTGAEDERGLPIGAEAPPVELPSLKGGTVSLESLRGRDTLLPWESSSNGARPRLVVVSSGDFERTRAEGFESLVLLDESDSAGAALGANGTPVAVLIDAEGRIASELVVGADAVLALTGSNRMRSPTAPSRALT